MERTHCIDNNTLRDGLYFVPFLRSLLVDVPVAFIAITFTAFSAEYGKRLLLAQLTQKNIRNKNATQTQHRAYPS